jgi:hypothetical protein
MKMAGWVFLAACAGTAAYFTVRSVATDLLARRSRVLGGARHYLVDGEWHYEFCMLARYPAATAEWTPWCTCDWKRGKCFRPR